MAYFILLMGSFGNAFVFTSEPRWSALASLPGGMGLVGYAAKRGGVWLLDAWTCTKRPHTPFTDGIDTDFDDGPDPLPKFDEICARIDTDPNVDATYGANELALTAEISRLIDDDVFYFAGDDEGIDMACSAASGTLQRFRLHFNVWTLDYENGRFVVTPRTFDEDPDVTPSEDVEEQLRAIRGADVAPPVTIEGGSRFYGAAVDLWPGNAGNPARTLGIGTWDPFLNLERDFTEVFARRCPA